MSIRVITGDCRARLAELEPGSVNCIVTSPPYFGLRDYGVAGQIGLEPSPEDYIAELVAVFRAARIGLRDDGTLWLNLGDSYASTAPGTRNGSGTGLQSNAEQIAFRPDYRSSALKIKAKDLMGIPWSVAFALRADGWWLRSDIIWHKPNPMPESVTDRPTSAHEHVFLLAKSERYYFDAESVKEPAVYADAEKPESAVYKDARSYNGKHTDKQRGHGRRHAGFNARWDAMPKAEQCGAFRNIRNVWTIATEPYSEAHFATFPPSLIEPCIKAGCPEGGLVLDPFGGAGTTGLVADRLKRNAVLIELNPAYAEMARKRIQADAGMFGEVA